MSKPLPMKLWLALEEDVDRHKAELAQAFADARARLLPAPRPQPYSWTPQAYILVGQDAEECRGLFGLGLLGL